MRVFRSLIIYINVVHAWPIYLQSGCSDPIGIVDGISMTWGSLRVKYSFSYFPSSFNFVFINISILIYKDDREWWWRWWLSSVIITLCVLSFDSTFICKRLAKIDYYRLGFYMWLVFYDMRKVYSSLLVGWLVGCCFFLILCRILYTLCVHV